MQLATNTQKIAFNTVIQIIGKVITTAIAIVMLAYLARYLGVEGYGDYTTIFAFLGFFAIIADMGFYTVAVREMSKNPDKSSDIMGNIFSLRIVFALIFLALAPLIGWLIPAYDVGVQIGVLIGTLSSFFILSNQLVVSVFQANLRMDRLVISDIIARIILFCFVMLFIFLKLSLAYFVLAHVVANFVLFIISFLMSREFLIFNLRFDYDYWKYILKEAIPLGVIIVLGLIYFKIDTIMLSVMKGSEAVGIYGAPYKILEILITIPAMFMGSVFPIISRYIQGGSEKVEDSFRKSFDFMSILSFPFLVGLFVLARPLVLLVLGNEFMNSVLVLQYLMFAVTIIFFGTIMGYFITAANLQKKLVWVYIVSVLVNVVGNFILIPRYSYIGASIATIFTEGLVCLLAFNVIYKYLKIFPRFNIFFKSILSSLLMGVILTLLFGWNLFLLIIIGGTVYFAVLYIIGGLNKEIIKQVLIK